MDQRSVHKMSILDLPKRKFKPLIKEKNLNHTTCSDLPACFQETCFVKNSLGALIETSIVLNTKYIYYQKDESTLNIFKHKWSIISSFTYETKAHCLYGINFLKSSGSQDFYFSSSIQLDNLLLHLENACFFSDFDQDFVILKEIESGTNGTVFLCQDLGTLTQYAVKRIRKTFLRSVTQKKLLKNEIKIMRKINHPFCVKLIKVYEEPESIMLVMEYVPFGTLLTRSHKLGKFQESEVRIFAKNLMTVLMYFNENNIIHRDLKLDNILMSSEHDIFNIKIGDFGLAFDSRKYQGVKCGSPGFMAPEILKGEKYDSKIDLFSFGVICFILISGKMPFTGSSLKQILDENKKAKVNWSGWKSSFSCKAADFLQSIMKSNKDERLGVREAAEHDWINSDSCDYSMKIALTRSIII